MFWPSASLLANTRGSPPPHTWLLCAGATVCLLVSSGCRIWSAPRKWWHSTAVSRQLVQQGATELERGLPETAQASFAQAVQACPSDPDARAYLAQVLWQQGKHQEAMAHQAEACRLAPRDVAKLCRAAEMHLQMGEIDAAASNLEDALEAGPNLATPYKVRAKLWQQRGQSDLALADLQRALTWEPKDRELLQAVSDIYLAQSRPRLAHAALEELATTYPADGVPQKLLVQQGSVLSAMGRHDEAIHCLRLASRGATPSVELWCELARAELAAGHVQQAQAAAHEAQQLDPQHPVYLALKQRWQTQLAQANEESPIKR